MANRADRLKAPPPPPIHASPTTQEVDTVNHPQHYTQGPVECIDAIESMLGRDGFIALLRGQVAKYNWRVMSKSTPVEDARKAEFYLKRLIEVLEGDQ